MFLDHHTKPPPPVLRRQFFAALLIKSETEINICFSLSIGARSQGATEL